jgi:hypothetical protein
LTNRNSEDSYRSKKKDSEDYLCVAKIKKRKEKWKLFCVVTNIYLEDTVTKIKNHKLRRLLQKIKKK